MLLTAPCPPGKYGYFSAKGAGLDHPFFQVVGDDQTEVVVSQATRDEGKGSAARGKGGGAYLLAALFLPAALAPSACKGNPEHLHQPRGRHRGYPPYPTRLPLKHLLSEG